MEHWSVEDYKNFTDSKKRKTKYRANKTSVDGHTFDSKKEAEYYCELKLRLQAKEINGFCLQPTFMLAPGLKYKADFIVFNSDNSYEVIDVKGVRTKEYIAKKKVFEDKYNIKINEILKAHYVCFYFCSSFFNMFCFSYSVIFSYLTILSKT